MGICFEGEYKGLECLCEGCGKVDGICIDNWSGGGCAVCEGPVSECGLTEYCEEPE
jgi:hypothetical protein